MPEAKKNFIWFFMEKKESSFMTANQNNIKDLFWYCFITLYYFFLYSTRFFVFHLQGNLLWLTYILWYCFFLWIGSEIFDAPYMYLSFVFCVILSRWIFRQINIKNLIWKNKIVKRYKKVCCLKFERCHMTLPWCI